MNKLLLKTLIVAVLAASPLTITSVIADTTGNTQKATSQESQKATSDKAIKEAEKSQNQLLKEVNDNVVEGLKKVMEATRLLKEDGKEKEAIAALEAATGKFDVALAANPKLGLVPVDAAVSVFELLITPGMAKDAIEQSIDLLKDGKVQQARALLIPLRDEIVTSTTYLPMATYPDAIKEATKALVEGKKKEAQTILAAALNTLVIEESIIPLALIRAESLLVAASKMDKEKEKNTIREFLEGAEAQLELATLLGYTDKNAKAYESIKAQLKALKKEIGEGNAVEKLYEKLKSSFSDLIGKESSPEKVKQNKTSSGADASAGK